MKDSANDTFGPRGNRAVSYSSFNTSRFREALDRTYQIFLPPGSSFDGRKPMNFFNSESDELEKRIEETTSKAVREIDETMHSLNLFTEHITQMLRNQQGLDEAYECVVNENGPKTLRKSLLLLKLRKTKTLLCSVCERIYFNYIHYLFHINSEYHSNKMVELSSMKDFVLWKDVLDIFEEDIINWKRTEYAFSNGEEYYYYVRKTDEDDNARPNDEWMESMQESIQFNSCVWARDDTLRIINKLEIHLNDGVPLCDFCLEAFSDPQEFMNHCLTFGHYEAMQKMVGMGAHITMQNITMILNEMHSHKYVENLSRDSMMHPASAAGCWEAMKDILPSLPTSTSELGTERVLTPQLDIYLLRSLKIRLDGMSTRELSTIEYGEELKQVLEPSTKSFSTLVRRIHHQNNGTENALDFIEGIPNPELQQLSYIICRTIDKGLPSCFYCELIFETAHKLCDHILTRGHRENFSNNTYGSDCYGEELTLLFVNEIVVLVVLETFKRWYRESTVPRFHPKDFANAINSDQSPFYCDVCVRSFIDFSFYIAHFWSMDHMASFKVQKEVPCREPYISLLIKHSSKEQLSRISKKVIDKYSASRKPFIAENRGFETRDTYFTLYVQFHYARKYEIWRRRQSYKRDEGRRVEYDEDRHVPRLSDALDMENGMKSLHLRAPYEWWNECSEGAMRFITYFSNFPPSRHWTRLNAQMKVEGTTPFCHVCELEFRSVDDYFMHFGEEEHPYPKGMEDPMAGTFMLVHIMYSEKRVGVDLDDYNPVACL